MFARRTPFLRLVALLSLVLSLAIPATASAQEEPCRSPIVPGTYVGTMDGQIDLKGHAADMDSAGPVAVTYRQYSEGFLLTIDCDGTIVGRALLELGLDLAAEGVGEDGTGLVSIAGEAAFEVDIEGYALRQITSDQPLLMLTFYPVAGAGEAVVETDFSMPKREFEVDVTLRFDIEDLDELLEGEGVPFPLQVSSYNGNVISGDVFSPMVVGVLSGAFEEGVGTVSPDDTFGEGFGIPMESSGPVDDVEVSASGTWQLVRVNK